MRILLTLLFTACQISLAESTRFEEQNFSLNVPAGWQKGETPPNALAQYHSQDATKGVAIMSFKTSAPNPITALEKFVSGAKEAAAKKQIAIIAEHDQVIHGVTFRVYSMVMPGNISILSTAAVVGDGTAYSIQGFSRGTDAAKDPEILAIINSFNLLSPPSALVTSPVTAEKSEAYKMGQYFGKWSMIALLVGAVVIMIQKAVKPKPKKKTR